MKPTPAVFPYSSMNASADSGDLLPILPMILTAGVASVTASGLVDSGAAVSVLPRSLDDRLGLDWQNQTVAVRLGGVLAGIEAWGGNLRDGRSVSAGAARVCMGRDGRNAAGSGADELLSGVRCLHVPGSRGI